MSNPNVPAEQKAIAESSAPDAKVVAVQPAQLTAAPVTMTAVPVAPVVVAPKAEVAAKPAAKAVKVEAEDEFRRFARLEREAEAALNAGDPTRDPVAKQKAMDKNTVAPGAVADAQKIKNIGSKA